MFGLAMAVCFALAGYAKDIKTVVFKTTPEMHCQNCENKIKKNIRFEKGVKEIETNLTDKTVTVTYDAEKTTVDALIAGFAKIDYKATVAPKACCGGKDKKDGQSCCSGKAGEKKEGSCCSEKK